MGKIPRVDVARIIYHAYNRAVEDSLLFVNNADYKAFEDILEEAKKKFPVHIFAYCLMPNHWHMVVQPQEDGVLALFFHWITNTHAKRKRSFLESVGKGHIYQGTYKTNICEEDAHFLRLVRYVERNALRAKLVGTAEKWRWSSAWRRTYGTAQKKNLLSEWPVPEPREYLSLLNNPQTTEELEEIRQSLRRGSPYGSGMWKDEAVRKFHLESTTRPRGNQPKNIEF